MSRKETTDAVTAAVLIVAGAIIVGIAKATDRVMRWVNSILFR